MAKKRNNWLLYAFLLIIVVCLFWPRRKVYEGFEDGGSCSSCSTDGTNGMTNDEKGKLLPIMDPLYNAREWCKQCVLLEDHLTHPRKKCKDCITKHCLTMEALAEEACTLDKKGEHQELLGGLAENCRQLQRKISKGDNHQKVAQEFRKIRKQLMPKCRDSF